MLFGGKFHYQRKCVFSKIFFHEKERTVYTRDILPPTKYTFFKCNFLDDDFKVGGVQMSTSFYVKVPRLQFVVYSCPFPLKHGKKRIADTKGKKVNRLQYQKNRLDMNFLGLSMDM